MNKNKIWKILEEVDVSPSKWFPLFKHKVELPNGKIVEDYYVSQLGDVSMIVAITKNQELVMVRQYKHGARQMTLELPAGRIGNKTPEEAAKAELEEETGYIVNSMISLGYTLSVPSKDSTKIYGFLVTDVAIQKEQKLDDNEDIEVVLVPLNKIEEKVVSGEFNGSDALAILHLALTKYPEVFR